MIPKEILEQVGKNKKLTNKEQIEKDYFQDLILYNIYKRTNNLIFKGGTALYKLYNLPRFSEDLDFSLLQDIDVETIIKETVKSIENAEIKELKKTKNSLLVKIGFKGILTRYNTVRIDINLKNDILEKFDVKSFVPEYIDINPFSLRVLNLKEIVAEKIHSLFAREKARDLYDLFFLLRFVEIDRNLVEKKLETFGIKFELGKLIHRIDNLKTPWVKELKSFVLEEILDFNVVKEFVLEKMKNKI